MNGVKERKKKENFAATSSRSSENIKFDHFTLLCCGDRQNRPEVEMQLVISIHIISFAGSFWGCIFHFRFVGRAVQSPIKLSQG